LHVLARDEPSLGLPLAVLRAAYGPMLDVQERERGEPIMDVRIGLEKRCLQEVRAALMLRGANPSEEYVGAHYCVLRFEAPLADLLGLPKQLAQLTSGKATHQIVLSRYGGCMQESGLKRE
jgi:translation elongation factor EF-G